MSRISEKSELTSAGDADLIPVVDTADTTQAPSGTTKYITRANLVGGKADADSDATENNVARFDGSGNPVDSGQKLVDVDDSADVVAVEVNEDKVQLHLTPIIKEGWYSRIYVGRNGRAYKGTDIGGSGVFVSDNYSMFFKNGIVIGTDYGAWWSSLSTGLALHWALNELSGTDAAEYDNVSYDAAFSGVTLDQQDGPTGNNDRAGSWDGVDDHVNLYTPLLNTNFPGTLGSFVMAVRPSAAGIWGSTTSRYLARFYAASSHDIQIVASPGVANRCRFRLRASNISLDINYDFPSEPTGWTWLGMSWADANNGDYFKAYVNSALVASITGAGAWTETTLNSGRCVLGRESTTSGTAWSGNILRASLADVALTDAEHKQAALQP